eukprot:CAMPEP_0178925678 /NCGR_PEP_ID=MMETSP0786-20121207/18056_1 /TAXON_ID=186022 /ORGANISM="Thalassionema frauenfeldii, Strain CCMP 1798" /LENGTH=169 /DNA_ID=CAMNT_0020600607 /DNA_START=21 /DNA_END=530 /DNA_ORIENTATION=+
MNRTVHGKIRSKIDGESAAERSARLASFTEEFLEKLAEEVTNGNATNMAFVHEDGYVIAITEGNENNEKEAEEENIPPGCEFCGKTCQKDVLYDELAELAEELAEDKSLNNKERRWQLYTLANRLLPDGGRGKKNRKILPKCISAEIHDFFPEENRKDYVGFREAECSE